MSSTSPLGTHDSVRTPLGDRELEELPELLKINSPTQKPVVRISKNGQFIDGNGRKASSPTCSRLEKRNITGKKRQYIALMVSKVVMGG